MLSLAISQRIGIAYHETTSQGGDEEDTVSSRTLVSHLLVEASKIQNLRVDHNLLAFAFASPSVRSFAPYAEIHCCGSDISVASVLSSSAITTDIFTTVLQLQ